MSTLVLDISISLDGYATGANPSDDVPMGTGGERLHAWMGGDDLVGDAILGESNGRVGGTIAGRRTYDRSVAYWGADGPGGADRTPTFIVSHTVPSDVPAAGVYTFVPTPEDAVAAASEGVRQLATVRLTSSARRSAATSCAPASSTSCACTSAPSSWEAGSCCLRTPARSRSSCSTPARALTRCTCTTRSVRQHEGHIPRRAHGCLVHGAPLSQRGASGDAAGQGRRPRVVHRRGVGGVMGAHASLTYRDIDAALAFLQRAFGAVLEEVGRDERGVIRHAAVRFGDGIVLVQPDLPEELHGTHLGQGWVYVDVDDPDAHHDRARTAGAQTLGVPHDAPEVGVRGYSCRDPEGNLWSFGAQQPDNNVGLRPRSPSQPGPDAGSRSRRLSR